MVRSFVLLCSAVAIRIIGGAATVIGVQAAWFDPLAAWACWIVPLTALELWSLRSRQPVRLSPRPVSTMGSQS
jgi:hypothetical protein